MSSEPLIGEIMMFGGYYAPRGWALCAGQLLPITQNYALFSLLGNRYGGDGRTTFALPDMRGRFPIHSETYPNFSSVAKGGSKTLKFHVDQLSSQDQSAPLVNALIPGDGFQPITDGYEANIMPPHLEVSFCIALTGIYPCRS